jgi:hypothetical protein
LGSKWGRISPETHGAERVGARIFSFWEFYVNMGVRYRVTFLSRQGASPWGGMGTAAAIGGTNFFAARTYTRPRAPEGEILIPPIIERTTGRAAEVGEYR